jgi:hypothetical protein
MVELWKNTNVAFTMCFGVSHLFVNYLKWNIEMITSPEVLDHTTLWVITPDDLLPAAS